MTSEKDWLFFADEYIFDLRTVGVLLKDGKIIVQRDANGNEYALPVVISKLEKLLKMESSANIKKKPE